jgi:hypothetical protein
MSPVASEFPLDEKIHPRAPAPADERIVLPLDTDLVIMK